MGGKKEIIDFIETNKTNKDSNELQTDGNVQTDKPTK